MNANELVPTRTTRRRVLVAAGTGISAAVAGCLGDDEDDANDGTSADGRTDDATDGDDRSDTDDGTDDSDSLVGVPVGTLAEGVEIQDVNAVVETVAAELDLAEHEVRIRLDEDVVEVYDDVSESAFIAALDAADADTDEVEIRTAVTSETINTILDVLEHRLDETDIDASVRANDDRSAVVFDGSDAQSDRVEDLLEPLRVELVAGYPDPDADEPVMETVVTQDDIVQVSPAQRADAGNLAPHVPVLLSDEAAEWYATVMTESGFTADGIGKCSFDSSGQPDADEYCLYTRFDGELIYGAAMGPALADAIEEGEFVENPSFVLQTQGFETAQRLEVALRAGQLPTELQLETDE